MVWNQHRFMVGIDYTDDHFALPLYWVVIGALIVGRRAGRAAPLDSRPRWWSAAVCCCCWSCLPSPARSYVKPNEISLERPYIQTHIEATRAAYGLGDRLREVEMHTDPNADHRYVEAQAAARQRAPVGLAAVSRHRDADAGAAPLLCVSRTTDVDRYTIDGQYRQVLLSPRELDITQLPGTQSSWINPHFIYTHGYGLVMAEVSKITPDGQPVYLIQDMPPDVKTPSLKITRPELYYGELQQDPVFVDTAQEEFDYPKGSDNAKTRYAGQRRISHFVAADAGRGRAPLRRFQYHSHRLSDRSQPHDDSPPRARTAAGARSLSDLG